MTRFFKWIVISARTLTRCFTRILKNESLWLFAALLAAVGTSLLMLHFNSWVMEESKPRDQLVRAQTVQIYGIFGIALVTFCTVIWRGLISARQADNQQEQIRRLGEQIRATEEANLAQLLQKGAEIISASTNETQIPAAIASLKAVAIAGNSKFSTEAMNLLAEYVRENGAKTHNGVLLRSAINAMNEANEKAGVIAFRNLRFTATDEHGSDLDSLWVLLTGVKRTEYEGGYFANEQISLQKGQYTYCKSVDFQDCLIIVNRNRMRFAKCHFNNCHIALISTDVFQRNLFSNCDLSGANIEYRGELPDLRKSGNFYFKDRPPDIVGEHRVQVNWDEVLIPKPDIA